jgi:hypothetical protein
MSQGAVASAAWDAAVAAVAGRQQRQVTRLQLLAIGLDDSCISYRVAIGRLHRVHRGVYSVGCPPITASVRPARPRCASTSRRRALSAAWTCS